MKILEKEFKSHGYNFKQVIREKDIAVYFKTKLNTEIENWEVIKVQSHNGYAIAGLDFPPSETFPSSSAWGNLGWSYQTREEAMEKFNKLLSEKDIPKKRGRPRKMIDKDFYSSIILL